MTTLLENIDVASITFGNQLKNVNDQLHVLEMKMSRVQLCKDQNDMMKCVWGFQSSFNNDKQTIDLICSPEVENKLREIDAHITNMYNTNLSNTTREYVPLLREASTMRVKLTNDVVLKKIIKNEEFKN